MIYVFSAQKPASLGMENKTIKVEIIKNPKLPKVPSDYNEAEDQVYLDITGLKPEELKKAVNSIKKICKDSFWGIIDPKGASSDPASFFFMGASDYIGPGLVKKGLDKKRLAQGLSMYNTLDKISTGQKDHSKAADSRADKKHIKLPAGKFEGWKSFNAGTTSNFFMLYVSLSGKSSVHTSAGENVFTQAKGKLRNILQNYFNDADALLWMETENNILFLVPPRAVNCRAAVEASLKLILNSRLIGCENLGLMFPVDFTCALHYGRTAFQKPGKTGAVIAESVNYIFHLGAKKAEPGRLTISDEVPEEALPDGLIDLFNPAGVFEGIPIHHTKRFLFK